MNESSKQPALTVKSWLRHAYTVLREAHVTSARLDAEILLASVLKSDRTWLHAHDDVALSQLQLDDANDKLSRRLQREPVAYIIGHKEFYGRNFTVTHDVLVPRPETETMITLLDDLPLLDGRLIDIGTGSGCIGITAKLEHPLLEVVLSDISSTALAIARQNAETLNADVAFMQSDILSDISISSGFNFILANLPYVDRTWELPPELEHEPELALYAEHGGLQLINRLLSQAGSYLALNGYVLIEADPEQHQHIIRHGQKNGLALEAVSDYIVVLRNDA